jgi:hypothetical protein
MKHYVMKAYGAVDVWIHTFLTSAPVGGEWSASRPGRFTPGERAPGIHWIGGSVDPRAGLDVERRKFFQLKNPMTPMGIEHMIFWPVKQCLNQLHYHVPLLSTSN